MTKPIVIIDSGHGGYDPGGGSNKFWKEKDKTLEISCYQYGRFKDLGIPVAMTRDKDIHLGPKQRARIVRNSGAKYCISNHINAGGGDGAETIHSIYSDGKLARLIADKIRDDGQNIRRVFTRKHGNADYYYMHGETGSVETVIVEYGFADSKSDDVEQIKKNTLKYAESVVEAFCDHINFEYLVPNSGDTNRRPASTHTFKSAEPIRKGDQAVIPYPGHYFVSRNPMMTGKHVGQVQRALNRALGYQKLIIDEKYGPKTAYEVGAYQERHNLKKDRIVGPVTWHTLF